MRLTIRIHANGRPEQQSFAVLGLDTNEHLWSREAHQGIDLPSWGKVKNVEGAVALCAADSGEALCRLQGLSCAETAPDPAHDEGPAVIGVQHAQGAWRLQAVDLCEAPPEHRGFTTVN